MDQIDSTLCLLIERLKATDPDVQGIEGTTLAILTGLQSALRIGDGLALTRHQARLHAFWVQRVPWCSSLSRDIEKLLIQLKELNR